MALLAALNGLLTVSIRYNALPYATVAVFLFVFSLFIYALCRAMWLCLPVHYHTEILPPALILSSVL